MTSICGTMKEHEVIVRQIKASWGGLWWCCQVPRPEGDASSCGVWPGGEAGGLEFQAAHQCHRQSGKRSSNSEQAPVQVESLNGQSWACV
jgi:hypothetical protein